MLQVLNRLTQEGLIMHPILERVIVVNVIVGRIKEIFEA